MGCGVTGFEVKQGAKFDIGRLGGGLYIVGEANGPNGSH